MDDPLFIISICIGGMFVGFVIVGIIASAMLSSMISQDNPNDLDEQAEALRRNDAVKKSRWHSGK